MGVIFVISCIKVGVIFVISCNKVGAVYTISCNKVGAIFTLSCIKVGAIFVLSCIKVELIFLSLSKIQTMNIFHYFFGNDKQRAEFIFDFIAPFYGNIDKALSDDYNKTCEALNNKVPLSEFTILDIGTGTGAWISSISAYSNKKAVGTDFSKKMIEQAQKNHSNIEFILADGENLSSFADNSFDVVTASFVLHGMKASEREIVLKEMKRVARKYVMIHDFHDKTALFIKFLEFMERSDYKNFKRNFRKEMNQHFDKTDLIIAKRGTGVYVGELRGKAKVESSRQVE